MNSAQISREVYLLMLFILAHGELQKKKKLKKKQCA